MVSPMILIALPLATAFLIVLIGSRVAARWLALAAVALLTGLAPFWFADILRNGPMSIVLADVLPPLGIAFGLDALSAGFVLLIAVSGLLVLLYSVPYIPHAGQFEGAKKAETRYYALFLLLLAGSFGLVMTKDIFNLFVFFEILCISSYILVAYSQEERSLEAGIKYMILGSIGSAFMLVAIGLSYRVAGSLAMSDIGLALAAAPHGYALLVAVLFTLGFGIEAAIFPLNTWLPDAHSSAPSSISAVLSGFVIEVALVVLVRIGITVFGTLMEPALGVLALAGVVVGELAALGQKELKRTLAFSSIGQVGIMLFAFSLGTQSGDWAGLGQLLMHAGAKSALFLVSGYFILRTGSHEIESYRGLARRMPAAAAFFSLAALSLVGMPPFFGFFTKFRIIEVAAAARSALGYAGIVVILFGTVIEAVYLFRIVRVLYGGAIEGARSAALVGIEVGATAGADSATAATRAANGARADLPALAWIAVAGFIVVILVGGFAFPWFDQALQPIAAALAAL